MLYNALCTDSDYEIYFESDLIDLKIHDDSIDFYEGENRIGGTAYCFAWPPNGNEKIISYNDSFNTTVIVFPCKSNVKSLESMLSALGITAELYHQYEL